VLAKQSNNMPKLLRSIRTCEYKMRQIPLYAGLEGRSNHMTNREIDCVSHGEVGGRDRQKMQKR
jgi:hypothetical protein